MATVTFFQKPGCKTNTRQRQMLEAAGHTVIARNLLTEPWTDERLRGFFGDQPVSAWFNPAAPRVKSGEIDPTTADAATALDLLLQEPLLIRRPLIEWDGRRFAGFDHAPVTSLLGRPVVEADVACSRPDDASACPEPR
jgi:hypothetical protein